MKKKLEDCLYLVSRDWPATQGKVHLELRALLEGVTQPARDTKAAVLIAALDFMNGVGDEHELIVSLRRLKTRVEANAKLFLAEEMFAKEAI